MNIEDRVKTVIARQLGISTTDIQPTNSLVDELGGDSLDQIEIVMALEEEFEFDIDDDDGFAIKTVQQAIDYITGRVPA